MKRTPLRRLLVMEIHCGWNRKPATASVAGGEGEKRRGIVMDPNDEAAEADIARCRRQKAFAL
jgi:hypothetical protein